MAEGKGWPFDETPPPDPGARSSTPPPAAPMPRLWQEMESRITDRIEAGMSALAEKVAAAESMTADPVALLRLLVDIEVHALKIASDEMHHDGLIPSVPAGQRFWFDLARPISRYLRDRIGMPADPAAEKR